MVGITKWEIDGVYGVRCETCKSWAQSSYSRYERDHDARLHDAYHAEILAGSGLTILHPVATCQ